MEDKIVFKGNEGAFVTAAAAARLQERYLFTAKEQGKEEPIRAQFFGKEFLRKMLNKKGAMGIRIYHGMDENGDPSLVLVPTDAYGKNLVENTSGLKDMPDASDHGADGPRCPKTC
ncbi:hypothetical protein [Jiulongibacter sediminis]|uniref:hypothetical protein n=1 Tax=Jiulongibacter sediminis TaxID=1605367 RepID=UPI0006DCB2EE|nr:hypothetical protein [Jiulongibacter sediminis]TBX23938.1 hypothetical protein TK44_10810 [Jiulongibacter sediminis]